jgi:hypothetical protein
MLYILNDNNFPYHALDPVTSENNENNPFQSPIKGVDLSAPELIISIPFTIIVLWGIVSFLLKRNIPWHNVFNGNNMSFLNLVFDCQPP